MENIKRYFKYTFNISDENWDFLASRLCRCEYGKKSTLLKIGKVEHNVYFIEKGVIRYFIPKEETDITIGFNFQNEFGSGYDSFLTKKPSSYQIETLTDSILWKLTYESLQEIYDRTDIGNVIGRIMSEELLKNKSKRLISLLNTTAEERYIDLLSEQPHIIQLIPLKYIASYIGVTPQALSRIRKRIY